MKTIKYITALCVGLLISLTSKAQDQHFSQYFNQPMYLNPAMTGMFNADMQLSLIYRNQWNQLHRAYHNSGVSFDTKLKNGYAAGIQLLNQSAGDAGYTRTTGLANASYDIFRKNKKNMHLVVGLQMGFIQQAFDPAKSTFGSQYIQDIGFDPNNPSMENFMNNSQIDFDATAGVTFFSGSSQKRINYFLGAAISHVTRPRISFYDEDARLPLKYVVHGGFRYQASRSVILNPVAMIYYQDASINNQYGLNAQFLLPGTRIALIAGASYRQQDAVIPMMGMRYGDLTMVMSYDINASTLTTEAERRPGAFEVSLIYLFSDNKYDPEFVCPRL